MGLKAGIVGLPNVGNSTLFNAITKKNILAANYPFASIDPNVGVVTVPDKRLDFLNDLYNPKSLVPTTYEFIDIALLAIEVLRNNKDYIPNLDDKKMARDLEKSRNKFLGKQLDLTRLIDSIKGDSFRVAREVISQHPELLDLRALRRILPRLLVRDQPRGGGEDRVDDAEVVRAERAPRLREVDDRVHELRRLHLGRAPAELDVGLDVVLLEVVLDDADRLGRDALALEVLDGLDLRVVRDREHPADRIRRRLRVVELADLMHLADVAVLVDPVVPADTRVQKPELHVAAHLLRPEKTALDLLVVNRRNIRTAGARHVETRPLEESERRLLQTALRQT